jgi:hypothetical protein
MYLLRSEVGLAAFESSSRSEAIRSDDEGFDRGRSRVKAVRSSF